MIFFNQIVFIVNKNYFYQQSRLRSNSLSLKIRINTVIKGLRDVREVKRPVLGALHSSIKFHLVCSLFF